MDHKERKNLRLGLLGAFGVAILLVYLGLLFDVQVTNHDYYLSQSIRSIARTETVEASRGLITDRNGKSMVSSRPSYNLTFDASLLKAGQDENQAILELLELCEAQGVEWEDNLPISDSAPFSYTLDSVTDVMRSRFLKYLKDLEPAHDALAAYLYEHPETVLEEGEEVPSPDASAIDVAANVGEKLLDEMEDEDLTAQVLEGAGLSAHTLIELMRGEEGFSLPVTFSLNEARMVLGVRYELSIRNLVDTDAYTMAEDVDTSFISLINDGNYAGAKITNSSVRQYDTTYAAHILGYTTGIWAEDLENLEGKNYSGTDKIGRTGVEAAFEDYLHGTNGKRIVSTNSNGKVTGEYYSVEPVPGNTVELTIDLDLQQVVEEALAKTVNAMNEADGNETRGAAAAVLTTHGSEVLALASYPTYDPANYNRDYNTLSKDPANPLWNRATNGTYAPGSTFKPLTAIAALQEGIITPTKEIRATHTWYYPGDRNSYANCWYAGSHGLINVTEAITNSCNYFFAQMGYELGMDRLREYAQAFGLGSSTGIEIGDASGKLPENPQGQDQAPWAAFGQATQAYTPLQLANYIATLVNGGELYDVHLLKSVKTYDNSQVVAVGQAEPRSTLDISAANLEAVKEGMLGYTQPGGMVYNAFRNCIVTAGAKTGTAQLGNNDKNNGVFVCFAPYDDPEIVVSIVIEKGDAGANLASTAVEILNAYFSADEIGTTIIGENELLQ